MRRPLGVLKNALVFVCALLFLLEEWLWHRLTEVTAWIGALPPFRGLGPRIARLPPYVALSLLIVPAALLFPFKLAALWLMTRGHVMLGAAMIIIAKIVSTAFVARLFALCRDQLLQLGWFATLHRGVLALRDWVHAWMETQPAWVQAKQAVAAMRVRLRHLLPARTRSSLLRWRKRRQRARKARPSSV